ncbi:hypothetical protein OTU49_013293 [Cherax quadricarinatus]|uniref:Uncharacterized protein n=1 Tax=Cherax quadricarinatus TaxID=27406 RepID=A0AAW0VVF5_CHEQU
MATTRYSGDKDCDCEDEKVVLAQRLAIDDSTERDSSPHILGSGFALRPESEHTGTLAYRVVQFAPDGAVDGLPQGGVQTSVPSLLAGSQANGSPSDSPETRLALITSTDVPTDGGSAVVVSGGNTCHHHLASAHVKKQLQLAILWVHYTAISRVSQVSFM